MIKVASLVYDTAQGLGYLARDFVRHGVVTDVLVVEHHHHQSQGWYPDAPRTPIRPINMETAKAFCREMDVMLFFETPFAWELIPFCREHGVKTVLCVMHECEPAVLPYQPDYFLCPSALDYQCFFERGTHIPVPVNVDEFPWRARTEARVFVHNSGHGGLKGRNGTGELIDAIRLVKSDVKFIITSQKKLQWSLDDPRIEYRHNPPRETLYSEGDCFVFPERFNGLSLPLQEAHASGMAVMATARFPNFCWLPTQCLIPVTRYRNNRIGPAYREFQEAIVEPALIAREIDRWAGQNITELSNIGRQWAQAHSWEALKPRYMEYLQKVVQS